MCFFGQRRGIIFVLEIVAVSDYSKLSMMERVCFATGLCGLDKKIADDSTHL